MQWFANCNHDRAAHLSCTGVGRVGHRYCVNSWHPEIPRGLRRNQIVVSHNDSCGCRRAQSARTENALSTEQEPVS